ncbi:MAG: bifunctional (p)ppGpp synthetase/guanosine-3',5'-bis(diphosphate) 3'-pyrophosphohydrolase [Deltaproteobacteria bacterium]|nr:bifunctional (p)ppGpp synthetase/guanosine-3',5'-bis(diphosphate) 3'-pyrophosphohydrolase [Deltaproteobacteria bacterium]
MIRINTIIDELLSYWPQADIDLIQKAYIFSAKVHEGQVRLSGEAYLSHPLEVAWILTQMKLDQVTIAAGLLHDTIEDTLATAKIIEEKFGPEILHIVNGVTKISAIHFQNQEERQAENIRKMILAMSDDIRVILVKLADRLHNMRTLGFQTPEKQTSIAQETLDIYAPISARLGMHRIQTELEDLCLYYLEPAAYQTIKEGVARKREERERYIREVKALIQEKMDSVHLKCRVEGRPKHFYSIYKKMINQNLDISQLYDLIAFRVIVKELSECYEALGHIHSLWKPISGKFNDYISLPKTNHYQSLHTKVIGPFGERIEIQIRTEEMHRTAEEGIASHWQYKEGQPLNETDAKKFRWVRQLLESQQVQDPKEFLESVRIDLFPDEVYVFTPQGEVKILPKESTPIDFAYAVHTEVGHHCSGARVNKKMVPLRTTLQHGDVVEIITSSAHWPSKDWLKIVKTSKAKNRIRQWLKIEERKRSIDIGKDLLEKELRKHQLSVSQSMKSDALLRIAQELSFQKIEDLLAGVGFGEISVRQVVNRMLPKEEGEEKQEEEPLTFATRRPPKEKGGVLIRGIQDVMTRFAKCCTPLPGDEVVGFITRGRGITVHARFCPQVALEDQERMIEVQWDVSEKTRTFYPVKIEIWSNDKKGMLAEVSTAITSGEANILKADAVTTTDKKAFYQFLIEVVDTHHLQSVINNLKRIKGVINVTRSFEKNI